MNLKKIFMWGFAAVALGGLIHLHEWHSANLDAATGTKITRAGGGDSLEKRVATQVGKQMDSDGSFTDINIDSGSLAGITSFACGTETVTMSTANPGTGAASVATMWTAIISTSDGAAADVCTLADGVAGQLKFISLKTDGETTGLALTPTNFKEGTDLLFETVNDNCILIFDGSEWHLVYNNGGTVR